MPNDEDEAQPERIFFTNEFKRNLRQLLKKYRNIRSDIQPLLNELSQGQTPGDRIPGIAFEIFKVRLPNSDSRRGKSGGYRIVYQHTIDDTIILITLYSKTEQSDISPQAIELLINTYETQQTAAANPESVHPVSDTTHPPTDDKRL
jgi:mRNA-degrading endonuclease RelE of RelBE toxin-antitoxin system